MPKDIRSSGGSANIVYGGAQSRNTSAADLTAKAYTYRISGKIEVKYLKDQKKGDIILNDNIISLDIIEMYDKADASYCNLTFGISTDLYRSLQDDYRNSKVYLTMERYEDLDRTKDRKPETVWKDKIFYIMGLPKAAPSQDTSGKDPTDISKTDSMTKATLALVDAEAFDANRTLYNFIAEKTTVGKVLQYLISNNISNKRIRIGEPDNTTEYEQILIPPLNFPDAIKYLDKNYGLYKNGLIYFIGIEDLIICDKAEKVKSKEDPILNLNIILQNGEIMGPEAGMYRSTAKDKDTANLYSISRPLIATRDVTLKEIFGESITLNYRDNINDLRGGGGVKSDLKKKEKYFWSGVNRSDLGPAVQMEINETVEEITVTIDNSDMQLFDIAKIVNLNFDYEVNRDYTGTYRMTSNKHSFLSVEPSKDTREKAKLFKLITKFTLVRV